MIKYLPAICFALIPFGVWGQNIFFGHANTLLLCVTLLLFTCKPENNFRTNGWIRLAGLYLSCWIIYVLFTTFIGKHPPAWAMAMTEANLFVWAGMIFYLGVFNGSLKKSAWFNFICSVALAQAVLGILQWGFKIDPVRFLLEKVVVVMGQMDFSSPVGTLGNQNFLAAFLAISLPFFFRDKWKLCLPIIVFALTITHTTTAIGAAIIGVIFYFYGWKWACAGVIPAGIIFAIKYWGSLFTNARVEYWKNAWESTSHSWQTLLFGWGPGVTWQSGNTLHSEYVSTLFNFGLVGIIIMVGYICSVQKLNRLLLTAFVIACIDMVGNHALHTTPTAVLILVIMALMERENGCNKKA